LSGQGARKDPDADFQNQKVYSKKKAQKARTKVVVESDIRNTKNYGKTKQDYGIE